MHTVVVDIGGTSVKVWKTGESDRVKFASGKELTPKAFVAQVRQAVADWKFDRVSIGYPGTVINGRPESDPYNLAPGWVDFDFATAFHCPVRIMNDACMQALGSYDGGRMLYLGLGTSIGTAFIIDGKIVPLALGHLNLDRELTLEEALKREGLEALGTKDWRRAVERAAKLLRAAFFADYVVFGGGNAKKLKELPPDTRLGGNHNAYFGGLRMWEDNVHVEEHAPLRTFQAPNPQS